MPNSQADVTAGAPNLENYTDNGDGTISDNVTGLMWQKVLSPTAFMQPDALAYCTTTLNSMTPPLGGHSDWRLPSLVELLSLVDYDAFSPSINGAFTGTPQVAYFWTSSLVAGASSAWLVDFNQGFTFSNPMASMNDVRCVR